MVPGHGALSATSEAQLLADQFRPYAMLEPETPDGLPEVLTVLTSFLEKAVRENEILLAGAGPSAAAGKLTVFHGLRAPTISIWHYLERIYKYANCTPTCFVAAYVYLNRLVGRNSDLVITSLNVHRIMVTAVMVAAKFLDDSYFNNAFYAKVGGVTTVEMNRLELEFLFKSSFDLHISTEVFDDCFNDFVEARRWLVVHRPLLPPAGAEDNEQGALVDSQHHQGALVDAQHHQGALVQVAYPQVQAAYVAAAPPPVAYHQQPYDQAAYNQPMGAAPRLVRPRVEAQNLVVATSGASDGGSDAFGVNTPPRDVEDYGRPSEASRQSAAESSSS